MDVLISLPMQLFMPDLRAGERDEMNAALATIEEMGYSGVIVVDHILQSTTDVPEHRLTRNSDWRMPDPLTTLAYLAAVTKNLKIGTRVLVIPYRTPFSVAAATATVDSLSGGRLILGAAPGYDADEFQRLGIPRNQRGKMTDEYLEIIKRLWAAEEPIDFDGKYHQFTGAQLRVGPVQEPGPPIWIGGNGMVGLGRAVRLGDGWTPSLFPYSWATPTDGEHCHRSRIPEMLAWAAEERAKTGKPPIDCVGASGEPLIFTDTLQHKGRKPDDIQQFSCHGTVEEQLEEFLLFKEAGCNKYVIRVPGDTYKEMLDCLETFATKILPNL